MQVLNKKGNVIAQATEVQYTGKCMGERFVSCKVNSPVPIDFSVGDYCVYFINNANETFTLGSIPTVKKVASSGSYGAAYQYDLKFLAAQYELERKIMNDIVLEDRAADTYYTGLATWSTYGTAQELANRIQANLNTLYTGEYAWNIDVVDEGNAAELSFNNTNCWDALQMVHSVFNLNYIIVGRTIHIGIYDSSIAYTFQYGKGKGIYDLTRTGEDSSSIITRLRAYGSSRNLPRDYNKKGVVPKSQYITRLMLPGYAETLVDYIDSDNLSLYGIREGVLELDDIYPSILSVTATDLINAGIETTATGRIDEIVAVSPILTPEQGTFFIWIKDIGFQITDYRTPDAPKVAIADGALAGYEFEITEVSVDEKTYPGAKYRLRLNRNQEDNFTIPDQIINLSPRDHFVLLDIYMPDEYVTWAEQRLLARAKEYLSQNDHSKVSYSLTIDNVGIARIPYVGVALKEGKILHLVDTDLGIDMTAPIQDLTIKEGEGGIPNYAVTVSEQFSSTTLSSIQETIEEQQQAIATDRLQHVKSSRQTAVTLVSLRDNIFDPDGDIKDAFLRTMMLQVGADSMNYALDKTSYFRGMPSNMQFDRTSIHLGDDVVHHYAYGIGEEPASDWSISESYTRSDLLENQTYFVAIKARQDRSTAVWDVTEESQRVNAVEGHYIFNFGILYPVSEGKRTFVETRGMTSVYGDSIVAGKIQSQDGQTYFDLTKGVLHVGKNAAELEDYSYLKDAFANGSTTVGGGVVLTNFIGVKDGIDIVGGMTTGSLGVTKVPLLFAGANSLSDSFNAKFGVQNDGHVWTKSTNRRIELYDGEINFFDNNATVINLSPQEVAPGTGNNIFSNIISGSSGKGTAIIKNGNVISDTFDLAWKYGALQTTYDYSKVVSLAPNFTLGGKNGTVQFPGVTLRINLSPQSASTIIDVGNLKVELASSNLLTNVKNIYSNTDVLSSTYNIVTRPDGTSAIVGNPYILITIPAKTLTGLLAGVYTLRVRTNFTLSIGYLSSGVRPSTGAINMVLTKNGELSYSWSDQSILSKFFGNGLVFAKTANQYAGFIVDSNKGAALEVRSGDKGLRVTSNGIYQWDDSLSKWIMPGFGARSRVITAGTTLTANDNFVVVNSATTITIRLPSTPRENQVIQLKTINSAYTVNGNGHTIFFDATNQPSSFTIPNYAKITLTWISSRSQWMYDYSPV